MGNEDGTVWITFNGEIYNFRELRPELERQGHRFATSSDTEVILHAYEQHGEDCLSRFRGMFAFAIWDANRQAPLPGAGPGGEEAPLLRRGRRPVRLRLRAAGAAPAPRGLPGARPGGGRRLPDLWLRPRPRDGVPGGLQAPAGPPPDLQLDDDGGGVRERKVGVVLVARLPAEARPRRGGRGRRPRRGPDRGRPPPDGRRRPARGAPERRGRFERRRRPDEPALAAAREDVLDRVRREGIQRAPLRPDGGATLRHRPPRADRPGRRAGGDPDARAALRRAVRRLVGDPELLRRPAHPAARHGGAQRRRGRRELRGLRPLLGRGPGRPLSEAPRGAAAEGDRAPGGPRPRLAAGEEPPGPRQAVPPGGLGAARPALPPVGHVSSPRSRNASSTRPGSGRAWRGTRGRPGSWTCSTSCAGAAPAGSTRSWPPTSGRTSPTTCS